jgi:ribokinase
MAVVVFGSINMDMVTRSPRLPRPGETLTGHAFTTAPGGKGANQAVACARLGIPTRMVGRIGQDVFGQALRDGLASYSIDVGAVTVTPGASGVAAVSVDDAGENTIVVVPGANGAVGSDDLTRLDAALAGARVLLLQLEVPLEAVVAAARLARTRGVTVMLDPAPARELPPELYALADIITPNETEAAALVGGSLEGDQAVQHAAQMLHKRTGGTVIIKLGAGGAFLLDAAGGRFAPSFPVIAVDTVAAGDAFNGGLAAGLCEGLPLGDALRWGLAAGALAVTKPGAQEAMPNRNELVALLQR